jgi:hyaluronan synthase
MNKSKLRIIHFSQCVGTMFMEDGSFTRIDRTSASYTHKYLDESTAFENAYNFMKREVQKTGFLEQSLSSRDFTAFCFTQPHRDLKEIRLSAWVLSIVLADLCGIEYLWSSDSDTTVVKDCVQNASEVLATEPTAAGVSAVVRINTKDLSIISRMAQTAFAFDACLNRAALGAMGRSECLNGPGSMFRILCLREILVPWYRIQYPGSCTRTVS